MPMPTNFQSLILSKPVRVRRLLFALACVLASGWNLSAFAGPDKSTQTPCFCQSDPDAGFANEGSDYCAPVSVSDGLIYLKKKGFDELVDVTDHDGQIALVKDLAAEMNTDPTSGTGPGQIMTGLSHYAEKRGYHLKRLEAATWRDLGGANKKYMIGAKPDADWMTAAVDDPNVVVLFNFGWYQAKADGTYKRNGGHWVNVVGTGAEELQFKLHNPLLKPEKQRTNNGIDLEPVDGDFTYVDGQKKSHAMAGYYQAHGPGLPFGVSAAVLDAVIVFELQRD